MASKKRNKKQRKQRVQQRQRVLANFSTDVLEHILKRLPVRVLLRFRCVGKFWKHLIDSSSFIVTHLNHTHSSSQDDKMLIVRRIDDDYSLGNPPNVISLHPHMTLDFNSSTLPIELPCPLKWADTLYASGAAKGIVCMSTSSSTQPIVLCNPSTQMFKLLPLSPGSGEYSAVRVSIGFAYSPINDAEYRVVCFYRYPTTELTIEVFNSNANSWVEHHELDGQLDTIERGSSGIFLDRCFYWPVMNKARKLCILSYDMSSTFQLWDTGDLVSTHLVDFMVMDFCIRVLNNRLALVTMQHLSETYQVVQVFDIEKIGDPFLYSRKKHISFYRSIEKPITVWKDEYLLIETDKGRLISYPLNQDILVEDCEVHDFNVTIWQAFAYKESMVSPFNRHDMELPAELNYENATELNSENAAELNSENATELNSENAAELNSENAAELNSENAAEESEEKPEEMAVGDANAAEPGNLEGTHYFPEVGRRRRRMVPIGNFTTWSILLRASRSRKRRRSMEEQQ